MGMVTKLRRKRGAARHTLSNEKWVWVRRQFEEAGVSYYQLGLQVDLPRYEIAQRAKEEAWTFRGYPPDAELMVDRLMTLLERQMRALEKPMDNKPDELERDKEAALLGSMTRTLEKLMELKRGKVADKARGREDVDMEGLSQRLKQRIEELRRR